MSEAIKKGAVLIVTHVYATGPAQELETYLIGKVWKLEFIGHPFLYSKDTRSFYNCYTLGNKVTTKKAVSWKFPEPLQYVKDMIYTLIWAYQSKTKFDLYVGADPLNAVTGLVLKKMRKVNKVIFYTVDYVPNRFKNPFLNWFYHSVDTYCTKNCDQVWNLSQRMTDARKLKGILSTKNQIVVPIGVHFNRIPRLPVEQIQRKKLVYMGHLRKGQGIELIIESMPELLQKIPDIKLIIIGTGPFEQILKERILQLNISSNVESIGYIEDHQELEKIMTHCTIGLALYEPDPDNFTIYTDPSKPKQYMACGLPIITTHVPWISEDVKKKRLGQVIDYNKQDLIRSIFDMIENDKNYFEYRENAINYASHLEWEKIFSSAIQQSD